MLDNSRGLEVGEWNIYQLQLMIRAKKLYSEFITLVLKIKKIAAPNRLDQNVGSERLVRKSETFVLVWVEFPRSLKEHGFGSRYQ